ncbi:hypothetical protein E1J38_008530 [Seonamhaeicola sediminis]|uniref:Host attachment protein n=1 Tax=Seonamhaeicola sediminis TaxID=2528206 RepID=A0A562YF08_9FLAO|nr:hypothetical protein [Seonamhaeicola sediminis]TWO32896.1 hypothetical protein E1J38_008530 [Seonamhaeicola sediminis]
MKIGVWLDKEKAHIVCLHDGVADFKTVLSNVENFKIHGGAGTKFKGGPQDVVQDSKYLEREKHQIKAYFKDLATEIKDAEAIVLFGPAETGFKFHKELSNNYKELESKVTEVIKADSMTNNQVIAWVKTYFN